MQVKMPTAMNVQAINCLGITVVILLLPCLHLKIEAETQAGIYILHCNEQWKPKSIQYRYTKKAQRHVERTHLANGD
jgi:hypothetical protein